ncbi:plastocyanin/azurin family copper-binding protein [Rubellicoccus peritrichatus]|uniref:Plastocyanin/azurin family copper-binding protein n=1 Tax=Rubellicoccus peritrichatus TaxID=3080537 RepID=A0AAQ3L8Y7_9BACT|nr:plastocyanin/azurin family copper-binding protein [Puniceicoccus sp. CR14]WOO39475.1 plastocyanin/azurin family copper-binding protein [Puniceicoccus sp. CR14]
MVENQRRFRAHSILKRAFAGCVLGLLLFGCSGDEPKAASAPVVKAPKPVESPSPVLKISAGDNMKFNKELLIVEAGCEARIELTHTGRMPINKMAHNIVVIEAETDPFDVAMAAASAKDSDYVPQEYEEQIIAYTGLVGPGRTVTVDFIAPDVPGDYPFLCTFPGHFQGGMMGILRVVAVE